MCAFLCSNMPSVLCIIGSPASQRVHPWLHPALPVQAEGIWAAGAPHASDPCLSGASSQLCTPQCSPGHLHHLQVHKQETNIKDAYICVYIYIYIYIYIYMYIYIYICMYVCVYVCFIILIIIMIYFFLIRNFEHLIPDAPELIHDFLVNEKDSSCKRNAFMMLIHADQVHSLITVLQMMFLSARMWTSWNYILVLLIITTG